MEKEATSASLIHDFKGLDKTAKLITGQMLGVLIVAAILGVGAGYLLSQRASLQTVSTMNTANSSSSSVQSGTTVGSNDLSTFKDTAEGMLQTGGIDGEGQYHLVRPGGDSQNVYLVSSTVDLSKFVGKKIKVWGQTQEAQHAGWLMDVGRVQVL